MIKFKISILHFIILLWLIILSLQFSFIIDVYKFIYILVTQLFTNYSEATKEITLPVADILISSILFLIIPLLLFSKKMRNVFNHRISFTNLVITSLLFLFVFVPFTAPFNPDFQQQISVTRLLPPLTNVNYIKLKTDISNESKFVANKRNALKRSFDESIIYIDSAFIDNSTLYYFQKERVSKINLDEIRIDNNNNFIYSQFYLLGTDEFGRDILSRIIYGARISLFIGFCSVIISLILGLYLGFLAGYFGGIVNTFLSRFTDMFLAFPVIFFLILLLALFGNSLTTIILILGFSGWMSLFKIVRSEVISASQKDYIISARLLGFSRKYILLKEIFPVMMTPIIVNLVFLFGNVVLAEASLSYLGLGTSMIYPSWGGMIEAGQHYISTAWWMIFFPGFFLFITLYSANSLGRTLKTSFNPEINK